MSYTPPKEQIETADRLRDVARDVGIARTLSAAAYLFYERAKKAKKPNVQNRVDTTMRYLNNAIKNVQKVGEEIEG